MISSINSIREVSRRMLKALFWHARSSLYVRFSNGAPKYFWGFWAIYLYKYSIRYSLHGGAYWVDHFLVVCLGGMAMHVGHSSLELSTNASSSNGECELSSPSVVDNGMTNVMGVFVDTSSHESLEVHSMLFSTFRAWPGWHSVVCWFREGAMGRLGCHSIQRVWCPGSRWHM